VRPPKGLLNVSSLDVCFLMDCTGSMADWIAQTKVESLRIADTISDNYPSIQVRYAFVGYRDLGELNKRFEIVPFTTNMKEIKSHISTIKATGNICSLNELFNHWISKIFPWNLLEN
jgi:hypothetical protein